MEDVLGRELQANQRLIISVTEVGECATSKTATELPRQTIEDWQKVYQGLNSEQIDAIDRIVKTRANLTRHVP